MSTLSRLLGLDHPSNKPLLDVLNGVGRAFAQSAGLSNTDPGKLVLQLLLQKYAPQHLDPVMTAIEGVAVTAVGAQISKAEGLSAESTPASIPVLDVSTLSSLTVTENSAPVLPVVTPPVVTPLEVTPPVVPVPVPEPVVTETPAVKAELQVQADAEKLKGEELIFEAEAQAYEKAYPNPEAPAPAVPQPLFQR